MSTEHYYYVPPSEVPEGCRGPMLVERSMLDDCDDDDLLCRKVAAWIKRVRSERPAGIQIYVTIAAVMPEEDQ